MDLKSVPDIVRAHQKNLDFACETLDILNGNLYPYIDKLLKEQFSAQSYAQAKNRISPINVLPKIVDKLTNIYQTNVIRKVDDGKESDQDLVDYYVKQTQMNSQFNCANELYNACGATLIQPYAYKGKPHVRAIPNDKFVPYSEDPVEPNKPTHIILIYKGPTAGSCRYWVYSDSQISIVDQDGNLDSMAMSAANLEGPNPIGKIPFIYSNSSKYKLVPTPDADGLTLVKLLPVMLSDLNQAAMFQAFSIIYTIGAGIKDPTYAPNALWQLALDPNSAGQKPEVGQIKPQVDYDQVLNLIQSQLSMWLGTKGIRSASVGGLDKENFASGISKVIDEMDTYEARQKQVVQFSYAEKEYWELITEYLHPYWLAQKQIENVGQFTIGCEVTTSFAPQLAMQARGQVVADLEAEYAAGFTSRKRAIQKLNPELSDSEIDELIQEIDEERTIKDEQNGVAENNSGDSGDAQANGEAPASGSSD